MNSESVARVLGAIIGAAALIMAFMYGPMGQAGKPEPQKAEAPKAQPVAPPAPRGPVVREVPQ
jgi:hypothetical protein